MKQKIRTAEIIRYDNRFNDIRTFNLMTAKAQDLFFAIIAVIQKIDLGRHNFKEKKYRLRCKDVCQLGKIMNEKNDFDLQQLGHLISDINIHVPYIMHISSSQSSDMTNPQNEYLDVTVTAKMQKLFFYIPDGASITKFNLNSYIRIKSKYAKALYRLLLATSNGADHGIYCAASSELGKRIGTENSDYIEKNMQKLMRDIASTGDLSAASFGKLHFDALYCERNSPADPDKIIINYVWSPDRLT